MKYLSIFCLVISCHYLHSQSTIGLNGTYLGAYGLQHEISVETQFSKNIILGIKAGTNFNKYSTYKMGFRYKVAMGDKSSLQFGFDVGHLQNKHQIKEAQISFRTLEILAGYRISISNKPSVIAEIGIMNREAPSEPLPVLFRIGLNYRI